MAGSRVLLPARRFRSSAGRRFIPFQGVEGFASNAVVTDNHIENRGGSGIQADPSSVVHSTFSYIRIVANGADGINLRDGNRGNRVEFNIASNNGSDGIHAQGATANSFHRNAMRANAQPDAHDDARATNMWIANVCNSDLPAGTICRRSDPVTPR